MTAGRRSAAVLVVVLLSLAVPATAWAADTACDGSDDLLRLALGEECGLEVTVLGVEVRLSDDESQAETDEPEMTADSTSSPVPSPSATEPPAKPSPDDSADRDGSARGSGAAAEPEDGSTAAEPETGSTALGSGDAPAGDPKSNSPAMESAAGTASPAPHSASGDRAQAPADAAPTPTLDVPAAAQVDGRDRQPANANPQDGDSSRTRIAGPVVGLPGMDQPSLLAAVGVVATAAVLIALGVGVAAKGLSLARRRQRPVSSQ